MSAKRTLYICKAICWNCKKEFKAAYGKWERNEKQCVVSPGNFSEKEKAVVILRFFEDQKLSEIAKVLNENTNTVKTILYRSLKKLKLELTEGAFEYE